MLKLITKLFVLLIFILLFSFSYTKAEESRVESSSKNIEITKAYYKEVK